MYPIIIIYKIMILYSIITPIYKTPMYKIQRLYNSLLNQTYNNWEWIVFDDSPIESIESYKYVLELSKNDNRISLYSNNKNIGIIGDVKRKAFFLGKGEVLVEVDHDDELVSTCLENLTSAYSFSDEIGFVYGHCCELYEDENDIIDYGDYWAFGYGSYQNSIYNGKKYKVAIVGNINPKTIRHITGIPNHVRSWRKDIYHKIGGHNENLHVADDYELFIRTFLNTKIAKIDVFTYIQYFERDRSNTQFEKNSDIQEIVYQTAKKYNYEIHNKFLKLGIDDYPYIDKNTYNTQLENPNIESYANLIIPPYLLKNNLKINLMKMEENKNLYAYSRVYNIPPTIEYKQTEHYSNLIKWIVRLTNCQSYLELGVEYGTNIIEIKDLVKTCVGVDKNVVEIINKGTIDFYQMETDSFFFKNDKSFDIIFIDANHNFEQVKKDFDNSLKILNKYGIIILHDTDPMIKELLSSNYCDDSYKIINYISKNEELNIITFPIQETGMTFVMRKNDRRINNFIKK